MVKYGLSDISKPSVPSWLPWFVDRPRWVLASHRSMAFFELGALPRTEESQGIATMWGPQVYKPHYLTILIGIINHSYQSNKST